MNRVILFLLVVLIGCKSAPELTINDLTFPDFEREFVKKNKIDTTFLVGKNPMVKYEFGNLITTWDSIGLFGWKFDTVGSVGYDDLGRVIFDDTKRFKVFKYEYDSLGLLNRRVYHNWDITLRHTSSYKFNQEEFTLVQNWVLQNWTRNGSRGYRTKFKFNNSGQLIEEITDFEGITHRTYIYDNKTLIEQSETYENGGKVETERKTKIFYSKGHRPDSTICYVDDHEEGQYRIITFYDSVGLRRKSILKDTVLIEYRHKKKPGS